MDNISAAQLPHTMGSIGREGKAQLLVLGPPARMKPLWHACHSQHMGSISLQAAVTAPRERWKFQGQWALVVAAQSSQTPDRQGRASGVRSSPCWEGPYSHSRSTSGLRGLSKSPRRHLAQTPWTRLLCPMPLPPAPQAVQGKPAGARGGSGSCPGRHPVGSRTRWESLDLPHHRSHPCGAQQRLQSRQLHRKSEYKNAFCKQDFL